MQVASSRPRKAHHLGKNELQACEIQVLSLKERKLADQFRFMLGDTRIPSVSEKPVKSLGKIFTGNLKDTAARQGTSDDFDIWLSAVDKSGLPGKFKAWIYQHGILPRLLWSLLINEGGL